MPPASRTARPASRPSPLPFPPAHAVCHASAPAGSFWGTTFAPGDVLDLSVDQMEGLLSATSTGAGSKVLDNALFAHAESVTGRFFGRDVYYRGIVEFSNVGAGVGRAGGAGPGRAGRRCAGAGPGLRAAVD